MNLEVVYLSKITMKIKKKIKQIKVEITELEHKEIWNITVEIYLPVSSVK